MPAAARAANINGTGTTQVTIGPGVYRGCSIREAAAAAAVVRIWDNTSATGTLLAAFSLPANGSFAEVCEVFFAIGVFVEVGSGTVQGSVRI
jgi:hypothetical protein